MGQALGSLGGSLSSLSTVPNWMKAVLAGLTGAGELSNILNSRQRSQAVSSLLGREKAFEALTPQQLSSRVASATQPLSQGLTQGVGNVVQAEVGERGLAEAPGIFSAVLSQALAPYYQQNQNTALQEVFKQFDLPIEYSSAVSNMLPGSQDMSGLLALLLGSLSKPGAKTPTTPTTTASSTPPTLPSTDGTGGGLDFSTIFSNLPDLVGSL